MLTAFKSPCLPAILGLGGLFIEVLVYPIFCFCVFFFDGQSVWVAVKESSFSCLLTGTRKTPKESVKMFQMTNKEK